MVYAFLLQSVGIREESNIIVYSEVFGTGLVCVFLGQIVFVGSGESSLRVRGVVESRGQVSLKGGLFPTRKGFSLYITNLNQKEKSGCQE